MLMLLTMLTLLLLPLPSRAEPIALSGATMGTTYHIKLAAANDEIDAEQLQAETRALLEEINEQMSTYRLDSELSRFNRAPAGEWFAVSRATAEVVATALEIGQLSEGALDVTIAPVVRLWHFGPAATNSLAAATQGEADQEPDRFVPPSPELIDSALRRTGIARLEARLAPPALRKQVDGLEVDLSAIAKGYAVDRIADHIAERGGTDYLVSIGGEVRAAGKRPDGAAWKVAVERPTSAGRERQITLPLTDRAIATSGDYRNFFEHDGRRYSHVIDPATGRPIEHRLASVTVVADRNMTADAWSTALLVLGSERGFARAEKQGVAALMISRESEETSLRTTSHWKATIEARDVGAAQPKQ